MKFWHDVWCGDGPLSFCFLELFRISNDKVPYVVDLMKFPNGVLYWDMKFLLAVHDWELESLFNFMDIIYGVSLRGIGEVRSVGYLLREGALRWVAINSPFLRGAFGSQRSLLELRSLFGSRLWGTF